jgi:hypothetical protein
MLACPFLLSCRHGRGVLVEGWFGDNLQASFLLRTGSTAYSRDGLHLPVGAFSTRLRARDSLPSGRVAWSRPCGGC